MTKKPTAAAMPDPYFESEDGRFRLYQGDCLDLLPRIPAESVDVIFADPPYFLSNDGITCHAGRMVSVNKGRWDKSQGPLADHEFCLRWLAECRRIVKPTGSVWVSGTMHIIHSVGFAMQRLGMKLLNDITWVKPNPPPNLSCRYFTHATETVLWARKSEKARHTFNYRLMKAINGGKQMKSVWEIGAPGKDEKVFGRKSPWPSWSGSSPPPVTRTTSSWTRSPAPARPASRRPRPGACLSGWTLTRDSWAWQPCDTSACRRPTGRREFLRLSKPPGRQAPRR